MWMVLRAPLFINCRNRETGIAEECNCPPSAPSIAAAVWARMVAAMPISAARPPRSVTVLPPVAPRTPIPAESPASTVLISLPCNLSAWCCAASGASNQLARRLIADGERRGARRIGVVPPSVIAMLRN